MRTLALLSILLLSACGSTPITLDREWAMEDLKGRNAERAKSQAAPQVIVTPAPNVNVTVNAPQGRQPSFVDQPQAFQAPVDPYKPGAFTGDDETNKKCKTYPVYTVTGQLSHYERECY